MCEHVPQTTAEVTENRSTMMSIEKPNGMKKLDLSFNKQNKLEPKTSILCLHSPFLFHLSIWIHSPFFNGSHSAVLSKYVWIYECIYSQTLCCSSMWLYYWLATRDSNCISVPFQEILKFLAIAFSPLTLTLKLYIQANSSFCIIVYRYQRSTALPILAVSLL